MHLEDVAARLRRTPSGITNKARQLQLGGAGSGAKTLGVFSRETGYARSRITRAALDLGIRFKRVPRMDPRQAKQPRKQAHTLITSDMQEEILEYLAKVPDAHRLYSPTGLRTTAGRWGVGVKPEDCVACHTKTRPHYARGKCKICYTRDRKHSLTIPADGDRLSA